MKQKIECHKENRPTPFRGVKTWENTFCHMFMMKTTQHASKKNKTAYR